MSKEGKIIERKTKVHGNPWKEHQVTGRIVTKTRKNDADEIPPTLPDGTPLLTERPPNAQHPTGVNHLPDVVVRDD
ncbi:MAG TPA: hypothetical protein VKC53_00355 [Patescibacteria group bacterium]|nr:hypothetical protein [Patescibacteria group bacterium]